MKQSWEPLTMIWGASAILTFKGFVKNFIFQLWYAWKSHLLVSSLLDLLALHWFLYLEFPQTPDCQHLLQVLMPRNGLPSSTLSTQISPLCTTAVVVDFIACDKNMLLCTRFEDTRDKKSQRSALNPKYKPQHVNIQCTRECEVWWRVDTKGQWPPRNSLLLLLYDIEDVPTLTSSLLKNPFGVRQCPG